MPSEMVRERLLDVERTHLMYSPSITTVTFFRGDPAHASTVMEQKLQQVVEANPWLTGSLELRAGELALCYAHPPEKARVAQLFNPTSLHGRPCKKTVVLHEGMEYTKMCAAISRTAAEVPTGSACKNNAHPLVALSVVPDVRAPTTAFALVFSVSHVILDGFNYYQLLAMLSTGGKITSISPARKHAIDEANKAACPETYALFHSLSFLVNILTGMIFGRRPLLENRYVDPPRVAAEKAKATPAVKFVSTNDVVFSCFARTVAARVGLMAINWRERLPGFASTDVGNYEGLLAFGPEDYAEPALVRKSLASGPPTFLRGGGGEKTPEPLPGRWELLTCRVAVVSSWVFPHFSELAIDGCSHLLHIPCSDAQLVPFEFAIVYRPRAGQLAVVCGVRTCSGDDLMAGLPLGASVASVVEQ